MKSRRFQYKYRPGASRLHKLVGKWLRQEYPCFPWYQEYSVRRINHTWPNYRAKYDWCCPDLRIVIECQGAHHNREIQWHGRIVEDETVRSKSLEEVQKQDRLKREAAEAAGYLYVEVWYNEKPEDVLPERLKALYPKRTLPKLEQKQKTSYDKQQRERAREHRKQQYLRTKKWRRREFLTSRKTPDTPDQ